MAQAIMFDRTGGPEVLTLREVAALQPGAGEVLVSQVAIGVNFADTSLRAGRFPATLPSSLGSEAAGVVKAVGPGVDGFKAGDRVAYGGSAPGAYVSERVLPAAFLVKLPAEVDFETAAGMMSAGLTAAYLLRRTWPSLRAGDTILFTAAAGGVGQIAVQWAKALGLRVVGTVGSSAKAATAQEAGCDLVLVQGQDDIAERTRAFTDGAGVAAAFDSVGGEVFAAALKCVRKRGLIVSFGAASGEQPSLSVVQLAMAGSLYLTRPGLADYISDPAERTALTRELLDHVVAGRIKIRIAHRYPLAAAAQAHRDMEGRKTTGSLVLLA